MAYTTITDPSAYFQTALYTGNGGSNTITNDGNSNLQPDWLWIKARNSVQNHQLHDSSRGASKGLNSNNNNAEYTDANAVTGFTSDGFTMNNNYGSHNASGNTYVAWQWAANAGTTASNTEGSITSTVQANTTAGFSIITYTGTGSNATVGHGLGTTPDMVIYKILDVGTSWAVWHQDLATPTTGLLELNSTGAELNSSTYWNSTLPNSTVLSIGTYGGVNQASPFIAYCFAEKQGFSKFGKYKGNGNADGSFIYTGFKPAWVMIKRSDAVENWIMLDNKREPFNVVTKRLYADTNGAESTSGNRMDFVSNGFKLRQSVGDINTSGGTYLYMAFASNPFVATNAVPTTAR